jgi:hypothetical protein
LGALLKVIQFQQYFNYKQYYTNKNPQHAFLQKGSKAVLPHVADLRHVKDPYMALKRHHFGKITGPFSSTVPHFATRSARVDGDVEASGGESGNV